MPPRDSCPPLPCAAPWQGAGTVSSLGFLAIAGCTLNLHFKFSFHCLSQQLDPDGGEQVHQAADGSGCGLCCRDGALGATHARRHVLKCTLAPLPTLRPRLHWCMCGVEQTNLPPLTSYAPMQSLC